MQIKIINLEWLQVLLKTIFSKIASVLLLVITSVLTAPLYAHDVDENVNERAQILSSFIEGERADMVESFDERREQHKILFYMGVVLLIFILLTAWFGVSMAMLGKEVFVPHMIFAGLSVFLSIAHGVVAVVWFFPF